MIRRVRKTGEMGSIDSATGEDDSGNVWGAHAAVARALGGELRPFDQYQGPYIALQLEGGSAKLWGVTEDDSGFCKWYLEYYTDGKLQEEFSETFPCSNDAAGVDEAVALVGGRLSGGPKSAAKSSPFLCPRCRAEKAAGENINGYRQYGPGKFGTYIDSWIYELSNEGGSSDVIEVNPGTGSGSYWMIEFGAVDAEEITRIAQEQDEMTPTPEELSEVAAGKAAILYESSDGFVDVESYDTVSEAQTEWKKVEDEFAQYDETDDGGQ